MPVYSAFDLTLIVNHACNLRCSYCYTGDKLRRAMPAAVGETAIDRAVRSIEPGGVLELGFFGGEPLLEAELIARFIRYAEERSASAGVGATYTLTTNATVDTPAAWEIYRDPRLRLYVSFDGLPAIHDRHRVDQQGRGSSPAVLDTMRRLLRDGVDFGVVMVVRPDTVQHLAEGIEWLFDLGVSQVDPSLDLWATWDAESAAALEAAVQEAADVWLARLPHCSVSWFDEKAGRLLECQTGPSARCSFGNGQVAVTPLGNLYPCERIVGEDLPANPLRLAGNVHSADTFDDLRPAARVTPDACQSCFIQPQCSTFCQCSNFVRTGNCQTPDGLLCLFDRVCFHAVKQRLEQQQSEETVPEQGAKACPTIH